jgi:hypothetical protein
VSAGLTGLSITFALQITSLLNWLIRQTIEVENHMNAVARTKFYTDSLPQERPAHGDPQVEQQLMEQGWPQQGNIEFNQVFIHFIF